MAQDQPAVDGEHLRLLAIFHFIWAGLALVGLAFLGLHFAIMSAVIFSRPELMHPNVHGGTTPASVFRMFRWVYLFFALGLVTCGAANLLSGLFLLRRRHWTYSVVIAALDCLQLPLGTILGVFTLVVLNRGSVRRAYAGGTAGPH
jgi:hypothetical protein